MDQHKLFVGNMAARISQRDLWRFFSSFGPIDECAKFHESYAFVRFVSAADAQRARQQTHGAVLKGRKLKVEFAATASKMNKTVANQQSKDQFRFFSFPIVREENVYIQPLRRTMNLSLFATPLLQPSPMRCDSKTIDYDLFSNDSSTSEDFLRLAGIDDSLGDNSYEISSSPKWNSQCDSRYFPLSTNRTSTNATSTVDQNARLNHKISSLALDLTRIRLFSDVSSGFGDDSSLFLDPL